MGVVTTELPDLTEVQLGTVSPERLASVLTSQDGTALESAVTLAPEVFAGRTVWNVNSTAKGGGVAEMLQSLVPYARGAGVDTRWIVVAGEDSFFRVTKRIHNHLHGSPGDGGALDAEARAVYERVTRINGERLAARIAPKDVVLLHDPQTAGLIPVLRETGVPIVWRCHVGVDEANDLVRGAWDFLRPYVSQADACVFSTQSFVWDGLDPERVTIVAPSIDPFAAKNYELDPAQVARILAAAGIEDNDAGGEARFSRSDGSEAAIAHRSDLTERDRITPQTPLVVQVSRWDRLKDPLGVLRGFCEHIAPRTEAHLVLAGPAVTEVADDPEGLEVCQQVQKAWHDLAPALAARVHLVTLQMDDAEENAVVVNALQRRAQVVVQKSLAEGFGLTVAEAMWKARPVVASGLGGIRDQIESGTSGVLVQPQDLREFGDATSSLLLDATAAEAMGRAAQERVRENFLGFRHLLQYLKLMGELVLRP